MIIDFGKTIEFGLKISFDVTSLLKRFFDFNKQNLPQIISFFSGYVDEISIENFSNLEALKQDFIQLNNQIELQSYLFDNVYEVELVEYLGDLEVEIGYFDKIDKFLRSNFTLNNSYKSSVSFQTTLKRETVENLVRRVIGETQPQDAWVDTAKRNDLTELDYTVEGGNNLILEQDVVVNSGQIRSVIDNLIGERVLGKDLERVIDFLEDDFVVLPYESTFKQSVEILLEITKGDLPEFPNLGRGNFVGKNMFQLSWSTFIRQATIAFSTDDTVKKFSVKSIEKNGNEYNIVFEILSQNSVSSESILKIN